ncbi:MAG: hypothetical protein IKA20_00230 [Clostridia bacterium]|nr:hypothetical protein [Clostridia bacterium]
MKMKHYEEMKMELLVLAHQDVVTVSGFAGVEDEFGDPNNPTSDPNTFG